MTLPHVTLVNSPRGAIRSLEEMNMLFNYFVLTDGLPNLRGLLSSTINSQAISSANRAVEAELQYCKN